MHFDFLSFVVGAVTVGIAAWFNARTQNRTLANLVANNVLLEARHIIDVRRLQKVIEDPNVDFSKTSIYPIENEKFIIQELPSLTVQSDVHIDSYEGVYSKEHDLWFLIEESYSCEDFTRRYTYYLSDAAFNKVEIIKVGERH